MLRSFYIHLLRLHPTAFRQRFGDEMLSIFDRENERVSPITDAALSLLRQWTIRSEFWEERLASIPVGSDVPSFHSLDHSRPPAQALIHGASLSIVVIGAVVLAISYSHNPTVILPQIIVPDSARSTVHPPASPTPLTADETFVRKARSESRQHQVTRPEPLPTDPDPRADQRSTNDDSARGGPSLTGIPRASSTAARSTITVALDLALLRSYAGTYVSDSLNSSLVIKEQAGRLSLEMPGQPRRVLVPISESRFFIAGEEGQWLEFLPRENGSTDEVIYFGTRNFVAHRR